MRDVGGICPRTQKEWRRWAILPLAREGYDPDFGARPLKRTIQRLVQDPLARLVLAGEVSDGATVRLEVAGDELLLQAVLEPESVA